MFALGMGVVFDKINSFVQSADIDSMVQPMKDSHSI